MEKVFFTWGATCFACALFSYFFVYETKGLSLEQVDGMMRETSARNSKRWKAGDEVREGDVEKVAVGTPEMSPRTERESEPGSSIWESFKQGVGRMRSVRSDRSDASS